MKNLFLLILVVLINITTNAQLKMTGEFRPRAEFLHGYKSPQLLTRQMFSIQTTQRSRINFEYKADRYKFGFQLQDVRAWGSQSQLVIADGANTSVHQAWGEFLFNENLSLKMGRMELNYDDQRIFGNVDWQQQGRSHDLALLKYEKKDAFSLHIGWATNQVQSFYYNIAGNYKAMQFLWFNKKFGKNYTLSLLALNNGVQNDTVGNLPIHTVFSQTIGQRSVYTLNKFTFSANAYYQMGNDKSTYIDNNAKVQYKKLSAYDLGLDASYKLGDFHTITLGYELLSGIDQTDTTTAYKHGISAFNPLYGTNHKFNGWMDYFYVGNHANSVGLQDIYLHVEFKKEKHEGGIHIHQFLSAAPILDAKEFIKSGKVQELSSNLGTEFDIYGGYKFTDEVAFKAGISFMLPTSTLTTLRGGKLDATNYWGWMQFVFKPNFMAK